ncbi:hypothetical protein CL622_00710 [archaeon]|nr:hypothetical protein [archaeon]
MKGIVAGPGGARGFIAGVMQTIMEGLGPDHFDFGKAVSSGVYPLAFYFSNQSEEHQAIYRHEVGGLGKLFNPFNKKPVLDFDFLFKIFDRYSFDAERVANSGKLEVVATNVKTGEATYIIPKTKEEVYIAMAITSAVPIAHHPVSYKNEYFIDGWFSNPLPIERAFEQGCDELVVIMNSPRGVVSDRFMKSMLGIVRRRLFSVSTMLTSEIISRSQRKQESIEELLENTELPVYVIRPSEPLPHFSLFDSGKSAINQSFDLGMEAGYAFLKKYT